MKVLRNEKGIALVTSLLLTLIGLAIAMALLYIVLYQSQLSGAHKRYRTALEASHGATELFTKQVIPYIFANHTTSGLSAKFTGLNFVPGSSVCMVEKMENATAAWGAKCGTDPSPFDPTVKPDMKVTMQGTEAPYDVYAKIVDTVPGNSDLSGFELLDSGAGVAGTASGVAPKHNPAMYRIEVQGQKSNSPQEKAELSVLYAY